MRWLRQWRGAGATCRCSSSPRAAWPTAWLGWMPAPTTTLVASITIDELAARLRFKPAQHRPRAERVAPRRAQLRPGRPQRALERPAGGADGARADAARGADGAPGAHPPKAQLQEKLYDQGESLESNTLEVHVHHLRRKLGCELIRTVRGVGYALGAAQARSRSRSRHEHPEAAAALPAGGRAAGVVAGRVGVGRLRAPRGRRAVRHRADPPGAASAGDARAARRRARRAAADAAGQRRQRRAGRRAIWRSPSGRATAACCWPTAKA